MKATEYMERMRNAKSYAGRISVLASAARDNELSFAGYLAIKGLYDQLNAKEVPTHV